MRRVLVGIAMVIGACGARTNVECEQDSNCDLSGGGRCITATTGNQWCAYPDSQCSSGFRFSDVSVGDGLEGACSDAAATDAGTTDAPTDAPRVRAYDVAYPKEWKFSIAGPVSGYFLVINTAVTPLEMNSLVVKSLSDDHPTAVVRIMASAVATSVPPGAAGGMLSGLSKMLLVDSGLVTETRADINTDYLNIELVNAPDGTYDIHVDLKLGLDNADISMPMTIHVVPSGDIYADPVVAQRLTVYR